MGPIISIVIPCYNSESTLESTLQSVLNQEFKYWEAIIVNDGSPDNLELIALKYQERDTSLIYHKKENGGLGSARNYGIRLAKGEYILPLDSDNQIEKDFTLEALSIFKKDSSIGVVHGDAEYFGEKTGVWKVNKFNLEKILVTNYIDACAIYKRTLWEQVGGYDEKMPYQGLEDWDFWISLGKLNVSFFHLNKITFRYYVSSSSMILSYTQEMRMKNKDYIVKKHCRLFYNQYVKVVSSSDKIKENFMHKLKSKKVVIDLFSKTFFGFTCFSKEVDNF